MSSGSVRSLGESFLDPSPNLDMDLGKRVNGFKSLEPKGLGLGRRMGPRGMALGLSYL